METLTFYILLVTVLIFGGIVITVVATIVAILTNYISKKIFKIKLD